MLERTDRFLEQNTRISPVEYSFLQMTIPSRPEQQQWGGTVLSLKFVSYSVCDKIA